MIIFNDLKFKEINKKKVIGKIAKVKFKNGCYASIISHSLSLGGKEGLYEIAIFNSRNNIIDPYVLIDMDNLCFLDENEVTEILSKIENKANG